MIKVGGLDIKLVDWPNKEANAAERFGEFSISEMLIRIDSSHGHWKTIDVLMHELLHCIHWVYHIEDEDKEERIVSTTSSALTQVFRDNPWLVQAISGGPIHYETRD